LGLLLPNTLLDIVLSRSRCQPHLQHRQLKPRIFNLIASITPSIRERICCEPLFEVLQGCAIPVLHQVPAFFASKQSPTRKTHRLARLLAVSKSKRSRRYLHCVRQIPIDFLLRKPKCAASRYWTNLAQRDHAVDCCSGNSEHSACLVRRECKASQGVWCLSITCHP